ncbi:MAG: homocitrate synthase [Gammaproteobacteria bacterium]|nr:homocitrate synthase [Gammaproteobacteria bacterium]
MQCKRTGKVKIVDATLREGNQAPGVQFTVEQSVEIATFLEAIGVDTIEIGHPLAGPNEHERTRAVAQIGLDSEILAHARAHPADIKAVSNAGAQWVGVFLGVNEITTKARVIGKSFKDLVSMVRTAVSVAKDNDLKIRYSCEDASRTDSGFLLDVFGAAIDSGVDRICYADTIGLLEPQNVAEKVGLMKSVSSSVDTEVHLHDDRGLSMANSLAAIDAGVDWVSTSVNGLGERCGITDLAMLLANLGFRGERDLPSIEKLKELSNLVSRHSEIAVDRLRPIIGENAFMHGSKLHVRATSYEPRAYDWIKEFLHNNK